MPGKLCGLSQGQPKLKMAGELKEMLRVAAYNSGSDRESCKSFQRLKACVIDSVGTFNIYSNHCNVGVLYCFSLKNVILL